jgi:hypothetical protein
MYIMMVEYYKTMGWKESGKPPYIKYIKYQLDKIFDMDITNLKIISFYNIPDYDIIDDFGDAYFEYPFDHYEPMFVFGTNDNGIYGSQPNLNLAKMTVLMLKILEGMNNVHR